MKHELCTKDQQHGRHQFRVEVNDAPAEGTFGEWTIDCEGDLQPEPDSQPPSNAEPTLEQELRAAALMASARAYTGDAPYEGAQPAFAAAVLDLAETYYAWLADGTRPEPIADRGSSL